MLYMLNSKNLRLITLLFVLFISGRVYGDQNSIIKWEPVHGAGGYIVEIIDSDDKTVIKKETRDNSLNVGALLPGIYKYRITTLNKLKEAGENTGWLTLTIKKEDIIQDVNVATGSSEDETKKKSFALGIGWEYNIPLPQWSSILDNSYSGLNVYISFSLSQVKLIKNTPFISSCGIEAQAAISQYSVSDDRPNRSDLTIYGFHAGFNYLMPLDSIDPRMKLIFNIDPGLSYSKYSDAYKGSVTMPNPNSSTDFSLISGVSVRYLWTNSFFTDISTQYYRIFYISHPFNDIKLILRIGMNF